MDTNFYSNGNSKQVGNLTVLTGSHPFLPQLDSPTVEPEVITVDENLNTPPPPSVTPEYSQENLNKHLHLYLEADICLDTESKQILQAPSSPLDKDPSLTDLGPIDPAIKEQHVHIYDKSHPDHFNQTKCEASFNEIGALWGVNGK